MCIHVCRRGQEKGRCAVLTAFPPLGCILGKEDEMLQLSIATNA